jgi:hypothetical protein
MSALNEQKFMEWVGLGGPRPSNDEMALWLETELGNREEVDAVEYAVLIEAIKALKVTTPSNGLVDWVMTWRDRAMAAEAKLAATPDTAHKEAGEAVAWQFERRGSDPAGEYWSKFTSDAPPVGSSGDLRNVRPLYAHPPRSSALPAGGSSGHGDGEVKS